MRLFNTGIESPQFRLRGQSPGQPVATDGNRDVVTRTPADFRALIAAAPLASPTFTGTPAAPTATAGTNTTQIATTAYVRAAISALADSAPATLDTLNELAAALGDDPNFATTVTNALATKAVATETNVGSTLDHPTDNPFHATQRFSSFDKRGGVRTWNGIGPFSGSKAWYNVVDIRHRNGMDDGASGYGGELAWGMLGFVTRLAFRSRGADGTPTAWTEVWTGANFDPSTKLNASDTNIPRINGINVWTGSNDFRSPVVLRDIETNPVKAALPTGIIRGTSNDGEIPTSTVWEGSDAGGPSIMQSPSRGQICHSAFGSISNDGTMFNGGDAEPYLLDWSLDGLKANKLTWIGLSPDLHLVTTANVTMTKMRAVIDSTTARFVTLPSPATHSVAIIMVKTVATSLVHRARPPSGSVIYWTDHTGEALVGQPDGIGGGTPPGLRLGMYWFASDGAAWYLMSPASAT